MSMIPPTVATWALDSNDHVATSLMTVPPKLLHTSPLPCIMLPPVVSQAVCDPSLDGVSTN